MVWKGLHHRLGCRWGCWREKTWSATWCPFHQLHPPLMWNHQCWNKAPCGSCWMRTFVLPVGLHELPEALLFCATWNRKVCLHKGKIGIQSFYMRSNTYYIPIHPHSGWSVAIAKMPLDGWHLQSWSIMMQRPAFSPYLGIRTPLSSRHISKEHAARSHEGAIQPCLVMRRQHVLRYSQQSKCVCVCLQPNLEQISEEPLNGTYKLIAKWLKSLDCYLSVSLQEALCHSSMRHVSDCHCHMSKRKHE